MATKRKAPAKSVAQESNSTSVEDTQAIQAAMQEQFKVQLKQLLKSAKAAGLDINELYETPPSETVSQVFSAEDLTNAISTAVKEAVWASKDVLGGKSANIPLDAYGKPVDVNNLPPGSIIPGTQNYVPWNFARDLKNDEDVTFTPLPVPSLVWPIMDSHGRMKMKLDKNNLAQWLTVGETCTVKKFFYDQYKDALDGWMELENFKRTGPVGPHVPWGLREDGKPNWLFTPQAASFAMNEEGRSLRIGPPTALDFIAGETPQVPSSPGEGEGQ